MELEFGRVTVKSVTGCWEWQGALSSNGYGMLSIGGLTWRAHRLAYAFFNGPIPDGLVVRHKCDNPPCINPAHLEVGTYRENLEDCYVRGRRADGETVPPVPKLRQSPRKLIPRPEPRKSKRGRGGGPGGNLPGELHSTAKLTEVQAQGILDSREAGTVLAARYGVSVATVSKIRNGRLWRHLKSESLKS